MSLYSLAKSTFAKTKDAMNVCLLYIALGKKNVLGALAKISKAEQNKVMEAELKLSLSCCEPKSLTWCCYGLLTETGDVSGE